jgi:hypothetical protein
MSLLAALGLKALPKLAETSVPASPVVRNPAPTGAEPVGIDSMFASPPGSTPSLRSLFLGPGDMADGNRPGPVTQSDASTIAPFKFLPAQDDWEKALAAVKVKPDSALSKALDESFRIDADQPAKRLAMLPKILMLATNFKKSKEVVAAGANAVKVVQELINVIPVVHREREREVKEFREVGAREVTVHFDVRNWKGKSFRFAEGYVAFEPQGMPSIIKSAELGDSGMVINRVVLAPHGMVALTVYPAGTTRAITGSCPDGYALKPGRGNYMQFSAEQNVERHKIKAKSLGDAKKKIGIKGSIGVDFTVFKAGGEITDEYEYSQGYEEEVEWEIEVGVPNFYSFRQTQ